MLQVFPRLLSKTLQIVKTLAVDKEGRQINSVVLVFN